MTSNWANLNKITLASPVFLYDFYELSLKIEKRKDRAARFLRALSAIFWA